MDTCPEFNGYNIRLCQEQVHMKRPKTKVVYLPLIDKPLADPDTIDDSITKGQQVSESWTGVCDLHS